nr:retrotransposon Gag protein [Tanacetum cinerariifolium]
MMADDGDDTGQKPEVDVIEAVESDDISILNSLVGHESPFERMCLPVKATNAFKVYIGTEETLLCESVCSHVTIRMQGLTMEVDLYVLPMQGPDVVLSNQWLQKLGKVTHDYAQQSMEFTLFNTTSRDNGSPKEATWKCLSYFQNAYPDYKLGDKVTTQGADGRVSSTICGVTHEAAGDQGIVAKYQREFEKLMYRFTDILENLIISFYISGLKPTIQRELLIAKPITLGDAFSLARIIEARLEDQSATSAPATKTIASVVNKKQSTPHVTVTQLDTGKPPLLPTPTQNTATFKPLAIKWISLADREERLDKGTHNFVRPDVVERKCFPFKATNAFKVYIGTGETLLCESVCSQVTIRMQGLNMEVDLYILPMQGPDAVLVVERIGKVAYHLALPATSKIHLVFHVSILKAFLGKKDEAVTELPEEVQNGRLREQLVAICDSREVLQNKKAIRQVLVKWDNRDEVVFKERGNVTPAVQRLVWVSRRKRNAPSWQQDFMKGVSTHLKWCYRWYEETVSIGAFFAHGRKRYQWISLAELQERLNKGLCFNCDNKWVRGHKCPGKYLEMMANDGDDTGQKPKVDVIKAVESGDISILNSLVGHESPRSLQLWGTIGLGKVHVLIDNGSTYNFVRPDVVVRKCFPVKATNAFNVYIGTGETLLCEIVCS